MLLAYLLASAWAMSTVVGRSSDLTPKQMIYEKEDKTTMKSYETSEVMAIGDRSSNLKYVRAIQGSMIWEEIKEWSLKVKRLDGKVTEKSPDKLTDGELAQLKQACHDGLKCLAVNQLLMLTRFEEPLTGSKVSVRKAITKITQVLTQYTNEYYEDVYQYEVVKQSDDQTKVYETVTTILEDNKELCQVDLKPTTRQSQPKNVYHNTVPEVVNNNSTVNYNTTENYNINNGTINSATINIEPHSGDSVDGDRSKHETPSVNRNAHGATTNIPTGGESITNGAKNNAHSKHFRPLDHAHDNRTAHQLVKTTDEHTKSAPPTTYYHHIKPTALPIVITPEPSPENGDITGKDSATKIDTHNSDHTHDSRTHAHGSRTHAHGTRTHAHDSRTHAHGNRTHAHGSRTHAHGSRTHAHDSRTHAHGNRTHAHGSRTHSHDSRTHAHGNRTHAHGTRTHAHDSRTHAHGSRTHAHGSRTHAHGSRTAHQPVKTTDEHTKSAPPTTYYHHIEPTALPIVITPDPSPENGDITRNDSAAKIDTHNSGHGRKHRHLSQPAHHEPAANNKIVLNNTSAKNASDRTPIENRTADGVSNNTVELENSLGCKVGGGNNSDSDIVSAGSHNKHSTRKGLTEDGYLNNGNMKVKNIDNSNRNKGTIKGTEANNSINIGTTNNGPVNYGTFKYYTNNGDTLHVDIHDISQYVDEIDKMYSIILKKFSKV